jgi:hypothetical protein
LADLDASNPVVHNALARSTWTSIALDACVGDKEVAMSETAGIRIDVEAAKALVHWKSRFADEVAARARRLAAESGQPKRVTLAHYRRAAQVTVASLAAAILDEGPSRDDQQAA